MLCLITIWLLRPSELAPYLRSVPLALCYISNWPTLLGVQHGVLGHTWSLSIEEQFYLLWPPLLILLLRLGLSRRVIVLMSVGLLLTSAGLRAGLFAALPHYTTGEHYPGIYRLYMGLDTRGDALLAGCVVGLLCVWGLAPRSRAAIRACGLLGLVTWTTFLVYGRNWHFGHPYMHYFLFLTLALATGGLLLSLLNGGLVPLRRALAWSPLVGVGRISYGLYLLHIPVMYFLFPGEVGWHTPGKAALVLAVSLSMALLSFTLVERPFLRLKDRFAREPAVPDQSIPPQRRAA